MQETIVASPLVDVEMVCLLLAGHRIGAQPWVQLWAAAFHVIEVPAGELAKNREQEQDSVVALNCEYCGQETCVHVPTNACCIESHVTLPPNVALQAHAGRPLASVVADELPGHGAGRHVSSNASDVAFHVGLRV
jgi:hypothetical protein